MSFKIALFLLFATSAIAGKTGPDFVLPNGKDMHYNNPLLHLTHEQHMDIFGTSLFTLSNQDSNCMDLAFSHLYSDICSGTSFIHNSTAESLNIKAPSEIDHVGAKCLYDGCKDRVAKGLVTPSCDIVLAGPNSCSWNTMMQDLESELFTMVGPVLEMIQTKRRKNSLEPLITIFTLFIRALSLLILLKLLLHLLLPITLTLNLCCQLLPLLTMELLSV